MTQKETSLTKLISIQLGVDESAVKPESRFVEDFGADSLDTVELLMALEDAFELEIPDEDAKILKTVAAVDAYLQERGKIEA